MTCILRDFKKNRDPLFDELVAAAGRHKEMADHGHASAVPSWCADATDFLGVRQGRPGHAPSFFFSERQEMLLEGFENFRDPSNMTFGLAAAAGTKIGWPPSTPMPPRQIFGACTRHEHKHSRPSPPSLACRAIPFFSLKSKKCTSEDLEKSETPRMLRKKFTATAAANPVPAHDFFGRACVSRP